MWMDTASRQLLERLATVGPTVARFLCSARRSWGLWRRQQLHLVGEHLDWTLDFGDGTSSRVYRETISTAPRTGSPCLLVVAFRLRLIKHNSTGHALFRAESLLNTPMFAGFAGFRSKLWLTDAETAVYRGVYEWDGREQARFYAETLSRLLRLVSVRDSVRYHVEPDLTAASVLADPAILRCHDPGWWKICAARPPTHR